MLNPVVGNVGYKVGHAQRIYMVVAVAGPWAVVVPYGTWRNGVYFNGDLPSRNMVANPPKLGNAVRITAAGGLQWYAPLTKNCRVAMAAMGYSTAVTAQ
jgi:hypothetical protein